MANKQRDICDECDNCYYYWENNDTENECNGSEAPCEEWIAKRDIDWDTYHKWLNDKKTNLKQSEVRKNDNCLLR